MILSPIGKLYGRVMDARNALYDLGVLRSYSLGARAISVGNLTTGGTGKTPLVALIAEILLEAGETVCILTRGYGRANPKERVLVADGETVLAEAAAGGDEPVELALRLGGRAVIVADADRLSAGRWARVKFGVTAFVLDDGFQHRRVRRDVDIVCIDATNPCGNGHILPAGKLRESFTGLRRADAIVLTRAELVAETSSIESRLRRRNPAAPIFRAATRRLGFMSLDEFRADARSTLSGAAVPAGDPENEPVPLRFGAFCALGNPEAFFSGLAATSTERAAELVYSRSFPDHYRFKQSDVDSLSNEAIATGARSLVTTAKDAVKLGGLQFSLPCFVAIAEASVDDQEAFRRLVLSDQVTDSGG